MQTVNRFFWVCFLPEYEGDPITTLYDSRTATQNNSTKNISNAKSKPGNPFKNLGDNTQVHLSKRWGLLKPPLEPRYIKFDYLPKPRNPNAT